MVQASKGAETPRGVDRKAQAKRGGDEADVAVVCSGLVAAELLRPVFEMLDLEKCTQPLGDLSFLSACCREDRQQLWDLRPSI